MVKAPIEVVLPVREDFIYITFNSLDTGFYGSNSYLNSQNSMTGLFESHTNTTEAHICQSNCLNQLQLTACFLLLKSLTIIFELSPKPLLISMFGTKSLNSKLSIVKRRQLKKGGKIPIRWSLRHSYTYLGSHNNRGP